ncbi:MAG: hypothetical protein H7338_22480 [Candidatus Sericytochromatia bacterium]|nr:hypothetical protein [Candidatus Sericytochromatia bacterium]
MKWLTVGLLTLTGLAVALPVAAQAFQPQLKPSVSFDVLYGRGSSLPLATSTGPLRFDAGQLQLDDTYTNLARIGRVRFGLDATLSELATMRLSALLFSSELSDQPLTPASFADYTTFLRQRWTRQSSLWSRPFLLEDVQFTLGDPRVLGTMTLGQQWLPFGFTDSTTIMPPLAIAPQQTPISEYVNGLRLASGMVPWQLSAATRQRQIGSTVKWRMDKVAVTTGVYTGAGPNQPDNNGSLDLLARVDYINEASEIGLSVWRGQQPGFRQQGSTAVPYDRTVTGVHARLPFDIWFINSEYLLGFDNWHDGNNSLYRGGYLTIGANPDPMSQLYLQGAYIQHDNPFDGALTGFGGVLSRQVTVGYKRKVSSFAEVQNDLSYTWEDLYGDRPTGIGYLQYLAKVQIAF